MRRPFVLIGLAVAGLSVVYGEPWQLVLIASVALCFALTGLGFGWIGPRIFMKGPDGRLSPLSHLLYWPLHLLNEFGLLTTRLSPGRRVWDEIAPGLFLGRKLTLLDRAAFGELGIRSILDLTNEFARSRAARSVKYYRCIPLFDTFAPSSEQLDDGVKWLAERLREGPVYVHCAMGHARSATFVAAFLIETGQAVDIKGAIAHLKSKLPGVNIKSVQRHALESWFARVQRVPA